MDLMQCDYYTQSYDDDDDTDDEMMWWDNCVTLLKFFLS